MLDLFLGGQLGSRLLPQEEVDIWISLTSSSQKLWGTWIRPALQDLSWTTRGQRKDDGARGIG